MSPSSPRLGLALSGGTLKAAAHVGVIAALEDLGIKPHAVAGTSAGSFIAALYAHGYTAQELRSMVDHFPGVKLLDYGYPLISSVATLLLSSLSRRNSTSPTRLPNGLLRGRKLHRYFQTSIGKRQPKLPLYIVATDALTGQPVTFSNDTQLVSRGLAEAYDDLSTALVGSCSLPGLFKPVHLGRHLLIDGGLRHYVPVDVLRSAGCNAIIAVNLHQLQSKWEPNTFIDVLTRSIEILLHDTVENDTIGNDLFLIHPQLEGVNFASFGELKACVTAGKRAVMEDRDELTAFIRRAHVRWMTTAAKHQTPIIRIQASGS